MDISLKKVMVIMVVLVMGASLFVMSTPMLPKALFFSVFAVALAFSVLCAVTYRRILDTEQKDHSRKVVDVVLSSFELHAKLPKFEDIVIDGDNVRMKQTPAPLKNKVDSFEHHL